MVVDVQGLYLNPAHSIKYKRTSTDILHTITGQTLRPHREGAAYTPVGTASPLRGAGDQQRGEALLQTVESLAEAHAGFPQLFDISQVLGDPERMYGHMAASMGPPAGTSRHSMTVYVFERCVPIPWRSTPLPGTTPPHWAHGVTDGVWGFGAGIVAMSGSGAVHRICTPSPLSKTGEWGV